jgi:Concanavalin A-like lectin/glucanases superfamily
MSAGLSRGLRGSSASAWLVSITLFMSGACSNPGSAPGRDAGPVAAGNHALRFDGAMDYATAGTAGVPPGNQPQTVSMWVRFTSGGGRQTIFTLRRDMRSGLQIGIRDQSIAAWNVFGDDILVQSPALPTAGAWHHVAYVLDDTDGGVAATLYVDGQVSASTLPSPNYLTPLECWIGSLDGTAEFYGGDVDELRVWSVARSAAEIAMDMAGTVANDAPGLIAYFDCDGVAGTRVRDLSPLGNDMTLGGGDSEHEPALVPSDVP